MVRKDTSIELLFLHYLQISKFLGNDEVSRGSCRSHCTSVCSSLLITPIGISLLPAHHADMWGAWSSSRQRGLSGHELQACLSSQFSPEPRVIRAIIVQGTDSESVLHCASFLIFKDWNDILSYIQVHINDAA